MELTPLHWTQPKAAYDQYRPGLSPYLHHIYDLRASRRQVPPRPDHGPEDGSALPRQMEQALRDLIGESFR